MAFSASDSPGITRAPFASGSVRLLLASAVVISHFSSLPIGTPAVYLFFALSGYWVSRMWTDSYSRTRAPYFTYMVSRYWRLLPVLVGSVALHLVVLYYFRQPATFEQSLLHTIQAILILGVSWSPLIVSLEWSLDVEVQYYLIAPFLLLLLKRLPKPALWMPVILVLATALSLLLRWHHNDGVARSILPEFFCFFLFGVAAFAWPQLDAKPSTAWLLGALGILGFIVLRLNPATRNIAATDAALTGLPASLNEVFKISLALAFVPLVLSSVRLPSSNYDRHFGNLAYCLYLFHGPFRIIYYSVRDHFSSGLARYGLLAACIFLSLAATLLAYVLIDRPAERLRHRWVRSRRLPVPQAS